MANNPYVNKVQYGGQVLLDLTDDTVTAGDVLEGVTFHTRDGARGVGTLIVHNVIDGLTSESTVDALSANQGRILKGLIDDAPGSAFGTCIGQGANRVKAVTIEDNNWLLKVGCLVGVKFDENNSYNATSENPIQLNVNNTGGYPIYEANKVPTGSSATRFGAAGYIIYYMYDGTYWVWAGSSSAGASSINPAEIGFGCAYCSTAEETTAKTATLSGYNAVSGGIVAVKFKYAVPANSTLNINSRGAKPIMHKGAAITSGKISAGDIATFVYEGTNYNLLCTDDF